MELSDWEDEFLGSVSDRVKTYGRAFGDPEKGAPGQSLSAMQARKLKEIAKKAKGEGKGSRPSPARGEGSGQNRIFRNVMLTVRPSGSRKSGW